MKIKKCMLFLFLICGAVTVLSVGCWTGAGRNKLPKDLPRAVKNAVKNAPADTLIGIGKTSGENPNLARTIAATRARTSIVRQLGAMTQDMTRGYWDEGGIDAVTISSFEQGVTVALSSSTLTGAVVIYEGAHARDYWAVVMLRRDEAFGEIVRAQDAAKSSAPALGSFDITGKISGAFDKAATSQLKVN
jgi:hypothetical protein